MDSLPMLRKYIAWRKQLPDAALFLLVFAEVSAFFGAWIVMGIVLTSIILAPLLIGMWGFGVWAAIAATACGLQAVADRRHEGNPHA